MYQTFSEEAGMRMKMIASSVMLFVNSCQTNSRTGQALSRPSLPVRVCERQSEDVVASDGVKVTVCDMLFATRPHVRPPETDDFSRSSLASFYAALYIAPGFGEGVYLTDRNNKRYLVVDTTGERANFSNGTGFPSSLGIPNNRYLNYIYSVTGTIGSITDPTLGNIATIQIKTAVPSIFISGCAIDSFLLGKWEGTVSARLSSPGGFGAFSTYFDEADRIPLAVTFDKIERAQNLREWDGSRINDSGTFKLTGKIENFSTPATAHDHTVMPAIDSLGARNPFASATDGNIELYRIANMHGIGFDNHWVMTYPRGAANLTVNGMSDTLDFFTPPYLMSNSVGGDPLFTLQIAPHIPFRASGHSMVLTPIEFGQASGVCP
jgi:hypothetical protein